VVYPEGMEVPQPFPIPCPTPLFHLYLLYIIYCKLVNTVSQSCELLKQINLWVGGGKGWEP
jgi:hypothetical protein